MPQTVVLEEKMIIGLEFPILNPEIDEPAIPQLWQQAMEQKVSEKIPNKVSLSMVGLYTNYKKKNHKTMTYHLTIGHEVSSLDEIPKGLVGKKLPKATYEVFTCKGKFPDSLIKAWHDIRTRQMKRTFTGDFELYPPYFDPQKNHTVEIFIAVET